MAEVSELLAGFPQLAQLLSMQTRGAQQQEPLREALTQQSLNFLPKSSRAAYPGVADVRAIPRLPSGTGASGSDSSSLLATILKYLAAGGAGFAAGRATSGNGGNGAGGNLGPLGNALKKLFSKNNNPDGNPSFDRGGNYTGGGGSVSGNDPFGGNLPGYDNFGYFNDPDIFSGNPTDPSGGSGVGPGMQTFYSDGGSGADPNEPYIDYGTGDW